MVELDSRARGQGFETYLCPVVSLSKTLYFSEVLVIPRKWWLHPYMTEKLLTGTINLNKNKMIRSELLDSEKLLTFSVFHHNMVIIFVSALRS